MRYCEKRLLKAKITKTIPSGYSAVILNGIHLMFECISGSSIFKTEKQCK